MRHHGRAKHLCDELNRGRHRLGRERRLVDGGVHRGRRIECPAERLECEVLRVRGGVLLGAAKEHVLKQVRDACERERLVARPNAHSDAETRVPCAANALRQKNAAVRENFSNGSVGMR